MSKSNERTFELPYWIENCGDGSASVNFCATQKEADDADENQQEEGEGWGEPCSSSVTLKIKNGKLYFEGRDENYKVVWKELKCG